VVVVIDEIHPAEGVLYLVGAALLLYAAWVKVDPASAPFVAPCCRDDIIYINGTPAATPTEGSP
jgi:hypothetical protein